MTVLTVQPSQMNPRSSLWPRLPLDSSSERLLHVHLSGFLGVKLEPEQNKTQSQIKLKNNDYIKNKNTEEESVLIIQKIVWRFAIK